MNKRIVVIALLLLTVSCQERNRVLLGRERAEQSLKTALLKSDSVFFDRPLVPDESTAEVLAEAILFKVYGEDVIADERPYEIHLVDGYWVIRGTLSTGTDGGTFEIIINSMNAQVVKINHTR